MGFVVKHAAQLPIFVVAWLLIVKERWEFCPIGRTAGAMLMAVMTVVVQTLGPEEAFAAIEYGTLALLWGMMVLVEMLKDDALFDLWVCSQPLLSSIAKFTASAHHVSFHSTLVDLDQFMKWFVSRVFVKSTSLTPNKLLWLVSMSCGAMSALFTNDTMCIALTKTICHVCEKKRFHPGPFMVAIAMSANIGSAATLIGNPQNAIIASLSGVPFAKFLAFSFVAAFVCLVVNTAALAIWYRTQLSVPAALGGERKVEASMSYKNGAYGAITDDALLVEESLSLLHSDQPPVEVYSTHATKSTLPEVVKGNTVLHCLGPCRMKTQHRVFRILLVLVIIGTLAGFLANFDIGWCAAAGGLASMLLDAIINHKSPDRIFALVNWELLVFFSGLFITIEGLQQTEVPGQLLDYVEDMMDITTIAGVCAFTAIITIGCNVFNNVPLVLLVGLASSYDEADGIERPFMETIGDPELAWILLAWVSTVAGNLTLMGSVANLIVAEEGKRYFEMSFVYYSKFGFPITLITLYLGVAIIVGMWKIVYTSG